MITKTRTCADCGDEFNTQSLSRGFIWAHKCNDCNEFSDTGRQTIQEQTMSIVNGQMAESYNRSQAERLKQKTTG
jgi:hypothetical protein